MLTTAIVKVGRATTPQTVRKMSILVRIENFTASVVVFGCSG